MRKQIGPRLTPVAIGHLKALCEFHGMSMTGLIEHLIRQAARQMAEEVSRSPNGPITQRVDPQEVDEDEIDAERFRQLKGCISRAELERP